MPICIELAVVTFWQRLAAVFTTPSLTLFLLIGSTVLAISLLVLTLTKVGHARPITKCVILSVIAHILLLGYAYGTKLMFEIPVAQQPAAVNLHSIGVELEADEPIATEDEQSLDQFMAGLLASEIESLRRPVEDVPFELQRIFDIDQESMVGSTGEEAVFEPGEDFVPSAVEPQIESSNRDFDPAEYSESVPIEAEASDFVRRGEGKNDVQNRQPEIDPDEAPMNAPAAMQDVAIEPSILNQNSFPDEQQRVEQFESELVLPDAEHTLVDEFAAATGMEPRPAGSEAAAQPQPPLTHEQLLRTAAQTRRLGDGKPMPAAFQLRAPATRAAAARLRGGSDETEVAVEAALRWLASTQQEDGHWCPLATSGGREDKVYGHDRGNCGENADAGITALATLAFLGAGHTHLEGPFQANVQSALEYLIRNQAIDGELSGGAKLFARMYCHSMALLAISEALAMTGDHRLQPAVQAGVGYTVQAQDKSGGGWRYQPGDRGDMSQFGWNVMSLHAAQLGEIRIEPATKSRMETFLESCRTGNSGGLASYRPGEGPSTAMTAEALACTHFLGVDVSEQAVREARQRIMAELPTAARTNVYYWYYATMALNQFPGDDGQVWNGHLQRVLLSQQEQASGQLAGSWPPTGLWAGYGGRVYSTALSTLCLQSWYRYLPKEESSAMQAARQQHSVNEPLAR